MLLIADSGSTKTDWRLVVPSKYGVTFSGNSQNVVALTTSGINPYFLAEDEITALLASELLPLLNGQNGDDLVASHVNEVYFYGAGIATEEKKAILEQAINNTFPATNHVEANSDLLGAAHGLCGKTPGIACILGTGSNSCYYDGHQVIDNISPCGYVLGDEGSGASMGKKLLSAFLKRDLPDSLCERMRYECGLSKEIILERVYRQPFPNRFLAQHTPFIAANLAEPIIEAIVLESFCEFFDRNVLKYSNCRKIPCYFTGSVAFYFTEQLRHVAESRQINVGKIIKSPIDNIVTYHC